MRHFRYRTPRSRPSRKSFSKTKGHDPSLLLDLSIPFPFMSATIQAPAPPRLQELSQRTLLPGLALTSFAALLLELALTRLFSVVLFYHFAFLAISIALLGLGAGGVFAYLLKRWISRFDTRTLAMWLCMVNSVTVLLVLEIVLHVPVALTVTGKNFLHLTIIYTVATVPFFFTGLLFSPAFAPLPAP